MFDTNTLTILISTIIIIILSAMLLTKMQNNKQLQNEAGELKQSLESIDEQAKIIVRTDMELNRIQEELDRKISGLYALQKLSHTISTTMDENLIFKKLNPEYLIELGFEKTFISLWDNKKSEFILKFSMGYT